jgi:hypothetical protein
MSDAPPFDQTLRQALTGLDTDDVRLFYQYFEELKAEVRKYLGGKARVMPGESAIAHSALLSLFCDLALQQIPLSDTDEYGYPMLCDLALQQIPLSDTDEYGYPMLRPPGVSRGGVHICRR